MTTEEEIQVCKTYIHMKRGTTAQDIANTTRTGQISALNRLYSSCKSGMLLCKDEFKDGRYHKVFYPTQILVDRVEQKVPEELITRDAGKVQNLDY